MTLRYVTWAANELTSEQFSGHKLNQSINIRLVSLICLIIRFNDKTQANKFWTVEDKK